MFNKKLIKEIVCLLCATTCFLTLFGCSKEKPNDPAVKYPADVAAIDDFKCVCSTDDETEFVIENEKAKELYTYVTEQWEESKKHNNDQDEIYNTLISIPEQEYILLSFQDGEPLLFSSSTSAVSEAHYYGDYIIMKNDYMIRYAWHFTSFHLYYKIPEGTYKSVLEMISK